MSCYDRLPRPVRVAAVAVAAVAAAALPTSPAAASDFSFSRTSGYAATTSWTQVLDLRDRGFGNVHVGDLYAYEATAGSAFVFAFIDDYDCPPGVLPEAGGHGGGDTACTYVTSRQLEGQDVPFTIDRRLSKGHLQGSLRATQGGGHGEPGNDLGLVPADFTWTAVGDPIRSSSVYRFREGGTSYSDTYRSTRRDAAMSGRLGPMLFQDAARATGTLESFRSTSRSTSR